MATPSQLVFSAAAQSAAEVKITGESKMNAERAKEVQALIKEIESAKNFTSEYANYSKAAYKIVSPIIDMKLAKAGEGASCIMRRKDLTKESEPEQFWFEHRFCLKIYTNKKDKPVIDTCMIKLSCLEKTKMVEIYECDFEGNFQESNFKLVMKNGEIDLVAPNSKAAKDPQYKKLGL